MATLGNYFMNAQTLSEATAIYDNQDMTTLSSDGWYSDASVSREVASGILLPAQVCAPCAAPTYAFTWDFQNNSGTASPKFTTIGFEMDSNGSNLVSASADSSGSVSIQEGLANFTVAVEVDSTRGGSDIGQLRLIIESPGGTSIRQFTKNFPDSDNYTATATRMLTKTMSADGSLSVVAKIDVTI